jgi:hypothetical protein
MRIRHLAIIVAVIFFVTFSVAANAQERGPLREAPRFIREAAVQTLRELGIRPNDEMTYGITTDDCPSNCNDSVGGGFCFCDLDDDGDCPEGSDKVPTEERCRVKPDTVELTGGGLQEPLEVQIP